MEQATVTYLAERQCSPQWKAFLQNLADMLAEVGNEAELRAIAHRAGSRFASRHPLPVCDTLDEMALAMGQTWLAIDWGWAELHEHDTHLQILHLCSPIVAGFGEQHARWVLGYLEGAYQQWFDAMGSDPSLRVQQVESPDVFGSVEMKLAR